MLVTWMCLFSTHQVQNIRQKHTSLLQNAISWPHFSAVLGHHQDLQGTDPRLSKSEVTTLITLDLFLGGPGDDAKELKHVALK
jgi:hypothetical protein